MKKIRFLALLPLLVLAACGGGDSGGADDGSGNPPAFAITTTTLADAVAGVPYSAQLATTDGTAPISFGWATGFTPPAWLSLSSAGALSGTPTTAAGHVLEVAATDSSMTPVTVTRTLNLDVFAAPQITSTSLPRAIKGQAYTAGLTHNAPGSISVSFAVASGSTLPTGFSMNAMGQFAGATGDGGLFVVTFELLVSGATVDTVTLDLVVYESIPYTYIQDSLENNDATGTGTQLLASATPAGRLTSATQAIQATPLTLNSDQNITKPDPSDFFKFNIGTPGTIKVEVFFRANVGEVDAYLWHYAGSPTHAVSVVASSVNFATDDELIVYHNAQLSGGVGAGYYYLQLNAPADVPLGLWNRNAYTFRVSFNDLTIATESLEADSAGGSIDEQVVAYNQGGVPTAPSWSLAAGTLPNGVSFTTDGRFTGTPTEFGMREFTVQVEDGGLTATREIKVRFFDSSAGDYWQVRGERRLYDPPNNNPLMESFGDCMVVAPHPDYPTEGAIYVLGGYSGQTLDVVRVFHTDRAGVPSAKHFKFEDIGKPLPISVRYHGAKFVQHTYGGYIYIVGGEIGAPSGLHTSGDLWNSMFRLQVADGSGNALSHPLPGNWELLALMPSFDLGGEAIKGWGEFGLALNDAAADADDRMYLLGGRFDREDTVGSSTYARRFHNYVLMYEFPAGAVGSGTWHWKSDTAPYTARRFPAVAMINGYIYLAAGREGTPGQTGSGSTVLSTIEMYQPDPAGANAALSTAPASAFGTLSGGGGYYPMYAELNGSLYVWCGWNASFAGTKSLNRFDPNGATGTVTPLTDADWGTGFGGGVAHDGKLWIISGIGHGADSEAKNLVYYP
jgi:hypothetical protein